MSAPQSYIDRYPEALGGGRAVMRVDVVIDGELVESYTEGSPAPIETVRAAAGRTEIGERRAVDWSRFGLVDATDDDDPLTQIDPADLLVVGESYTIDEIRAMFPGAPMIGLDRIDVDDESDGE